MQLYKEGILQGITVNAIPKSERPASLDGTYVRFAPAAAGVRVVITLIADIIRFKSWTRAQLLEGHLGMGQDGNAV